MTPFTSDPANAVSSLGERSLIEKISLWLGNANPPAPFGIGDDCAVLSPSPSNVQQVVTADPVIYQSHFDDSLEPEQVATKLARRNLSDVAAMGGLPRQAIVSLALDPNVSIEWIERFYRELSREANRFDFAIVGGDLSNADRFLGAFMTLIGEIAPGSSPLLRKKSVAGSPILVTGTLGGSRIQKHHAFLPRIKEGQWLAKRTQCLSCTDLSDGLGKDCSNIVSDSLRCEIDCSRLPISEDARKTVESTGQSALYHVFNDGEDFELLFTLSPDADLASFTEAWEAQFNTPVSVIGKVVAKRDRDEPPLRLINAPEQLKASGYEHLRKA